MRISRGCLLVASVLLAIDVRLVPGASASQLTLAKEGNTNYRILVPDHAAPAEEYAATELANTLQDITGAVFSIVRRANTSADPLIVIGRNKIVEQLSGPPALKEIRSNEAFRIATKDRTIFLMGASTRATVYAVYYFLEKYLGCRWFSAEHSIIPKRRTVTLGAINVVENPRFDYREVFSKPANDMRFRVRNRLNGEFNHRIQGPAEPKDVGARGIHKISIFQLVGPRIYKKDHPEYFGAGQLRFGNSAVQRLAIEAVRAQLRSLPQLPAYLLIAPEDRETYFKQGQDRLLIKKGKSAAAAYIKFVRTIADGVRNQFPDVKILALAYKWSIKPPVTKRLPENMGIMLSDIDVDFARPLTSAANQSFLSDLKGWSQLTDEILIWDYITNFASYLQPYPNISSLARNLRILAAQPSVVGVFHQGAYSSRGGEFSELKAWVLSKLLWDPELNASKLMEEFAEGFYGAGAPYVLEYLSLLQDSIKRHPTRLEVKMPLLAPYLSAELLMKADSLFREAESAARKDVRYLRHIQGARLPVDYAVLASDIVSESDNERAARYRRFTNYLRKLNVTAYREGTGKSASVDRLLQILALGRRRSSLPSLCADRVKGHCIQVQDRSFRLAGAASLVTDKTASDGVAVRMPGNSQVWGVQVPLSWILPKEGEWQIFADTKISARDQRTDMPVLRAGIYPGKKKVMRLAEQGTQDYRSFVLPGKWKRDSRRTVWIAPSGAASVKHIYVDRIFAVRTLD